MHSYFHVKIHKSLHNFDRTIFEAVIAPFTKNISSKSVSYPVFATNVYPQLCSILNRKSSKLYMIAYYQMKIHISVQQFDDLLPHEDSHVKKNLYAQLLKFKIKIIINVKELVKSVQIFIVHASLSD